MGTEKVQIKLFEYDQIDKINRDFIQDRTIEIKALVKRSAQDIVDIGLKLIEVKDRLPHGMWGKWLDVEFGWKEQTARNLMNVSKQFKSPIIGDLNLSPTVLYLLAAPSTPDEAREEALNRASNGEVITHKAAKEIVNSYKEDEPSEDLPELIYDGGYAYCKYCYETHDRWDLSGDHDPDAWECRNCGHFTADQYMDLREKPVFTCPECDQTFNTEVWHCLYCNHHWQLNQRDCPNCHEDGKEYSTKKRKAKEPEPKSDSKETNVSNTRSESKKEQQSEIQEDSKPHVTHNSGENEWYTPERFIKAARAVFGEIDLDPASSEVANQLIQAKKFYDIQTDGLFYSWEGNIWLNPPYGTGLIEKFTSKLAQEFDKGNTKQFIILVNNATETKWFQNLSEWCSVICFVSGRIKYWSPERESHTPLQGQAILYGGTEAELFINKFKSFGFIVRLIH